MAGEGLESMKKRVQEIARSNGGRSLPAVVAELKECRTGCKDYFRQADAPGTPGTRDARTWRGEDRVNT